MGRKDKVLERDNFKKDRRWRIMGKEGIILREEEEEEEESEGRREKSKE